MFETLTAAGEPNRFRIVELLRSGPGPVNDIGERLQLPNGAAFVCADYGEFPVYAPDGSITPS